MAVTLEADMRGLLSTAGVGSLTPTAEWSLHLYRLPATPNRSISIARSGGINSNPRWALDYPSMQVMVRSNPGDYDSVITKAQAVKDALLGLPSQDIGTTRWVAVNMIGDISPLGSDEKDRPLASVNFALIIEPAPGANRSAL